MSPPPQPLRGARDDVAAVDIDFGAEPVDRHDEKIDRPRADGAAARHRHPRFAHARDQRRQHPEARTHFRDQFIGRGGVDDIGRRNMQRLSGIGRLARPLAADRDIDAVIAEDALQRGDIGKPRHIVENERLVGEETRDHQRQRGVLRARDRDGAVERPAADNANSIQHLLPPGLKPGRSIVPSVHNGRLDQNPAQSSSALWPYSRTGLRRNSGEAPASASWRREFALLCLAFSCLPPGAGVRLGRPPPFPCARAGLLLAALEVFPQRRRQPRAARRRLFRFAAFGHDGTSKTAPY